VSWTALERAAVLACSVALAAGLVLLISGYFTARDPGGVDPYAQRIGRAYADQGDAAIAPGQRPPPYDSAPPTSGPHVPTPVVRDARHLTHDELLTALAAGDVVIAYAGPAPPLGLRAFADRIAGPFTPALAADGQAVILDRRRGTVGLVALAWTRMAQVTQPRDPLLRQFVEAWLGRGAGRG
jgi:hypothetical protein